MAGTRQRIFFKKNKNTLPSACRLGTRQRKFSKKIKALCRVSSGLALGKEIFFKKVKNLCRVPYGLTLGKEVFLKKIKNLCRVPAGLALGKVIVNGTGAMTVAFFCRVSPGHSAKRALPIQFLPCVLCRVPHSAKALPSVI